MDTTMSNYASRLNMSDRKLVEPALQLYRIASLKLNVNDLSRRGLNSASLQVLCLVIAAESRSVPVDRACAVSLSGLSTASFANSMGAVRRLLDHGATMSIKELAAVCEAPNSLGLAEELFRMYAEEKRLDLSSVNPSTFYAAAILAASIQQKSRVNRRKLLGATGAKPNALKTVLEDMKGIHNKLLSGKIVSAAKPDAGYTEDATEVLDSRRLGASMKRKSETDVPVEDFDSWKRRILDS